MEQSISRPKLSAGQAALLVYLFEAAPLQEEAMIRELRRAGRDVTVGRAEFNGAPEYSLVFTLPASLDLCLLMISDGDFDQVERLLLDVEFASATKSALDVGTTVGFDESEFLSARGWGGVVLLTPPTIPVLSEIGSCATVSGSHCRFLYVALLTKEELHLKLRDGLEPLLDSMQSRKRIHVSARFATDVCE